MSNRIRLFIGSPMSGPPAAAFRPLTQSLLNEWASQPQAPALRWTPAAQWHLTWQFLGETPEEQLPILQAQLNSALTGKMAASTHWQQLAWWPSKNRPQILVGVLKNSPALQAMADAIASIVPRISQEIALNAPNHSHAAQPPQEHRQQPHQAFKPHITLARLKKRGIQTPMPALPIVPDGLPGWRIEEVTLFQSDLRSDGAVHTPLYIVPLPLPPGE